MRGYPGVKSHAQSPQGMIQETAGRTGKRRQGSHLIVHTTSHQAPAMGARSHGVLCK